MIEGTVTSPVFELTGPFGTAQLFDDGIGYSLFFEDAETNRTVTYCRYAYRTNVFEDAFSDAKHAVGLEDWTMTWDKFHKE